MGLGRLEVSLKVLGVSAAQASVTERGPSLLDPHLSGLPLAPQLTGEKRLERVVCSPSLLHSVGERVVSRARPALARLSLLAGSSRRLPDEQIPLACDRDAIQERNDFFGPGGQTNPLAPSAQVVLKP